MLIDVVMPQLGESVVEGVVVKWLVAAGDAVAKDQTLLTISTDKVDAEIPAPAAGRVAQLLAKEGETVPVLTVVAKIETEEAQASVSAAAPAPPWDEEIEGVAGHLSRKTGPPLPVQPRVEAPAPPPPGPPPAPGRLRITPVVGRMAAAYGLDLSKVPGTGIEGRVTRRDVEAYLASGGGAAAEVPSPRAGAPAQGPAPWPAAPAPPAPPQPALAEGDQVVPWTPIRKRIAQHMVASKQTSPHVHIFAEVDLHKAVAHRAALKGTGVSVTYLPYVMYAAAKALREFPIVNAAVSGESTILRHDIHIAVAVDTEKGLLVPVVRNADRKSLVELSRAVDDLGERAKAGKVLPDELSGGTFSVTNPGAKGNLFGTPIINQPQAGVLRMGQVVKRPVVAVIEGSDAIVIRPMMYLCMAYDHRIIDGVAGNGFLFRVREILEAGDFG
ncbi:MAG: Dihydrolipoyllysine-residue succinyltransferase [Deltaproteobacteria bacterium]|nr:Dihydrolipoyllysine-residue succinyltransferase [Deltaproteobacteria bacterium]